MPDPEMLFVTHDWNQIERAQNNAIKEEIDRYDENKLLNSSFEDLCSYFIENFRIDVPVLLLGEITVSDEEVSVDVSNDIRYGGSISRGPVYVDHLFIEVTIPFDGEKNVFYIRPSRYNYNPPRVVVRNDKLILYINAADKDGTAIKNDIDTQIESINSYLGDLRNDVSKFHRDLESSVKHLVQTRKDKILAKKNLVASIGYPFQERANPPRTYAASSIKKKLKTKVAPQPSSAPFEPEPCVLHDDYDHILQILNNTAHVFEHSPSAFKGMGEEDLRMHFLVQLNGHYEGQATGETFNFEGKTDILIREKGKNIFIGECKFWGGAKKLTETVDQLLGYSCWRDTKVAILIFNRNKNFSQVLKSIEETVSEHPYCKKLLEKRSETEFRYLFSHRDDPNREMFLTTLAFDVP